MAGWIAAACAAVLIWFSDTAMQSASEAAKVFAGGVMPALFPMMVLGRMAGGAGGWAQAVLMGWMSGSPASAQRAASLWQSGRIRCAEKLLCLTGVMSPMFFMGTLCAWGVPRAAAWRMLVCHWLGAALCALVWCDRTPPFQGPQSQTTRGETLPQAIHQSARSLLAVCGAMMLFSIIAGVLRRLLRDAPWTAALWAMLEIGGGAHAVLRTFHQPYALLCGLCSFGGLSIWLQNLLFTGEKIRPVRLLWMRMLHGAVSFLCYFFSLKIQNLLMT